MHTIHVEYTTNACYRCLSYIVSINLIYYCVCPHHSRISLCCYQLSFPGNWLELTVPSYVPYPDTDTDDTAGIDDDHGGVDRWEDHGIIIQYNRVLNMTSFTLKDYFQSVDIYNSS